MPVEDIKGHWAQDYIAAAYTYGLVSGVSSTEFQPDEDIMIQDVLVMILNANGSDALNERIKQEGGYPKGYLQCGRDRGIWYGEGDRPATSADVVNMLYHTYDMRRGIVPSTARKPVIYLYPQKEQEVEVSLELQGELSFTYPEYEEGWNVLAYPDGRLVHQGKEYDYLFWEGKLDSFKPNWEEGFVVKKEDTVAFLEESLTALGLTPKEYNDFIVYWAPIMMENEYNKVYFAKESYAVSYTHLFFIVFHIIHCFYPRFVPV